MYFQKNKEFNALLPHVFRTFHVSVVILLPLTRKPYFSATFNPGNPPFGILNPSFGIFNSIFQ